MNNTQLIQRLQSFLDDPEWPDCAVVSKDTLRAAIYALRADPTSQQEVAAPVSDDDLREALRRIQYEAVSLADAQVIALEALSISRVPVASLASREQGVEAVGAVPVIGIFHAQSHQCTADYIEWPNGYEPVDGMKVYTAPPSSKTHDDPWALTRDLVGVNINPANMMTTSELPKAPAPVLVVQGEAVKITDVPGLQDAVRNGLADGSLQISGGAGGDVESGSGYCECYCDPHREHCSVCQPSLWLQKSSVFAATPAQTKDSSGSGGGVQEPTIGPREIAKFLRSARGMGCNCDLDNWEPELSTGHSHVCRIHKAAIAADAVLKTEVSAAILSTASPAGEGEVKL